jgi:hypothetical protein
MPISQATNNREPRWPASIAVLAVGGLFAALPSSLSFAGPRWLLLVIVVVLMIPTIVSHQVGHHFLNQILGYIVNGVVTVAMIASVAMLLSAVTSHTISPQQLLLSAAALWLTNIIIFASWYWRLDAGGPHERARTPGHPDGAFLFPQMTLGPPADIAQDEPEWEPHFIDYLFLAFNTSTAFSPTDVPVLSRWAKILMMIQSLISLLVIALLAGRAVNIL